MPTITAVVNTLNEERNLPLALRSVKPWVDEIVVVDQLSDDGTVEIAKSFGAKVFSHEKTGYVEPVRQFAIDQATCDWILILDADEVVPLALSKRLRSFAESPQADIVRLPRENYICGRLMQGAGWAASDDFQTRFFRRGALSASAEIHRGLHPVGAAQTINLEYKPGEALVHFNYVDMADFLDRLNRYTTAEVSRLSGPLPTRKESMRKAWKAFRNRYFKEGGRREGWQGFYLSLAMAFYGLAIDAKAHEAQENGSAERVRQAYADAAESLLSEYER